MVLAQLQALAQARSFLAALADSALTTEGSSAYEHALVHLDGIHADDVPALDTHGYLSIMVGSRRERRQSASEYWTCTSVWAGFARAAIIATRAHADTAAQTPSRSRKPHWRPRAASTARINEPTRLDAT